VYGEKGGAEEGTELAAGEFEAFEDVEDEEDGGDVEEEVIDMVADAAEDAVGPTEPRPQKRYSIQ